MGSSPAVSPCTRQREAQRTVETFGGRGKGALTALLQLFSPALRQHEGIMGNGQREREDVPQNAMLLRAWSVGTQPSVAPPLPACGPEDPCSSQHLHPMQLPIVRPGRSSRDRLSSSSLSSNTHTEHAKGVKDRRRCRTDGHSGCREVTGEWQAAADARPMPHTAQQRGTPTRPGPSCPELSRGVCGLL